METLRTEYIVILPKSNFFCSSAETFNNLLSAHADIKVNQSQLSYKDIEVDYEIHESALNEKDLRFFHLKFECHQIEKIDEFDELLRTIRTVALKTEGTIRVLWNDIAFHYAIKSYPLLNEIENLMRRLIDQFMITTIGADWDKEALPQELKRNEKKTECSDITAGILHKLDFIQLAGCLFNPYSSKDIQKHFESLKKAEDILELDLDEMKKFVPESNWTRYFSTLVNCDDGFLKKRWEKLYEFRCLVAHNNLVKKSDYESIVSLITEIKPKIQDAIDNLDSVNVPEQEKEYLVENITINSFGRAISYGDARRMVTVVLPATDDKIRDQRRLQLLHGLFRSCPGSDRYSFMIHQDEHDYLVEFPHNTTGVSTEMLSKLTDIVGEENVRITTLNYKNQEFDDIPF